uniref:Murine leukemia virus integrase C-terminal domain-containing protein n=1 Tax=Peromyscus maniculatus bairdii TaxID=230844 RepID=A0A8C8UFL8_PERMB
MSHTLAYKGLQTLPPSRILSLQVALLEDATFTFWTCPPLNISNLFPQPNWQGPFKVILVTLTAAKLEGFPHWVHLSHLKPFISPPSPQKIYLSSYTVKQTGPCTLKLQRTSGSTALSPVPEE